MKNLIALVILTLPLAACEATVNSNGDSLFPPQPSHYDSNASTLCAWARDTGMGFDGDRTVIEQNIWARYGDGSNRASGKLRIYLDCSGGDSRLSWDLDANQSDSWDSKHLTHRMDMTIGSDDGSFTLSGKTVDYKNMSHFYCTETQNGNGVSRLERVIRDGDYLRLTVSVSGTISADTRCDCQGMNCDPRYDSHTFRTSYDISLHPRAENFACASAQYDYNAQAVDRVCRGHYN